MPLRATRARRSQTPFPSRRRLGRATTVRGRPAVARWWLFSTKKSRCCRQVREIETTGDLDPVTNISVVRPPTPKLSRGKLSVRESISETCHTCDFWLSLIDSKLEIYPWRGLVVGGRRRKMFATEVKPPCEHQFIGLCPGMHSSRQWSAAWRCASSRSVLMTARYNILVIKCCAKVF